MTKNSTNKHYHFITPKVEKRREEILGRLKDEIDIKGSTIIKRGNRSLYYADGEYYFQERDQHYRLDDLSTYCLGEHIEDQFFFDDEDANEWYFDELKDVMKDWLPVFMGEAAEDGVYLYKNVIRLKYNHSYSPTPEFGKHSLEISALIDFDGEYFVAFSDQNLETVIKGDEEGVMLDELSVDDMAVIVDQLYLKWREKHPVSRHIRLEYFNADFHEQVLYPLDEKDLDIIQKMFDENDDDGIRQFCKEYANSFDKCSFPGAWWYDEPYNLHLSIDVDGECIHSSHASRLVRRYSLISDVIPSVTAGNDDAETMLFDMGQRSRMCVFDNYLSEYGQDEQWILIESLEGECERGIEFDINDEFDADEMRFVYDKNANPDSRNRIMQILMDRIIYGNKLYGDFSDFRCRYSKDKFVLAKINSETPGGLSYIKEVVLK